MCGEGEASNIAIKESGVAAKVLVHESRYAFAAIEAGVARNEQDRLSERSGALAGIVEVRLGADLGRRT